MPPEHGIESLQKPRNPFEPRLPSGMPSMPTVGQLLAGTGSLLPSTGSGEGLNTKSAAKPTPPAKPAPKPAAAPPADDGKFHSPYSGAFMSGIRNTTVDAKTQDREISGRGDGHGYGVYGPTPHDQRVDLVASTDVNIFGWHTHPSVHKEVDLPLSQMDAVSDIAAVTQYAAAADQAMQMTKGADGKPTVKIDWKRLHEIPIQSNLEFNANGKPIPGSQKITYDSPGEMADKGAAAVLETAKKNGNGAVDKNQFLSITGHSGGGQSSFYTAMKLASDGYKNLSVVGVDMAMTPQERKMLETMGVKVTNITSHTKDEKGSHTSEIGEFIRIGMGGGDNNYDLNVERQSAETLAKAGEKPAGLLERHSADNDANVATMVRFAQYLDASGQHGKYSDKAYQEFLAKNKHGNELQMEGSGHKLTADAQHMPTFEDNRGKGMGKPGTEEDFRKWFAPFVKDASSQFLPLPDKDYGFDLGPIHAHYNPMQDISQRIGDTAANNTPGMVGLLQGMGVDTTHIRGLEKYNAQSPSNNWGKSNPINVPLPSWLDVQPVK